MREPNVLTPLLDVSKTPGTHKPVMTTNSQCYFAVAEQTDVAGLTRFHHPERNGGSYFYGTTAMPSPHVRKLARGLTSALKEAEIRTIGAQGWTTRLEAALDQFDQRPDEFHHAYPSMCPGI